MEKSIENIWKTGFIDHNALVAPKIINLYNQKSIHVIDKIMRMGKVNLIYLVVLAAIFLLGGFIAGTPYLGLVWSLLIVAHILLALKHTNVLKNIDKSVNSYQYIKTFDEWITYFIADFMLFSRFFYPIFFLSFVIQARFTDAGRKILNYIITSNPDMSLFLGVPTFIVIIVFVVTAVLALCGGLLYKLDLNIVYGRVLKKLNEILTDMEELKH